MTFSCSGTFGICHSPVRVHVWLEPRCERRCGWKLKFVLMPRSPRLWHVLVHKSTPISHVIVSSAFVPLNKKDQALAQISAGAAPAQLIAAGDPSMSLEQTQNFKKYHAKLQRQEAACEGFEDAVGDFQYVFLSTLPVFFSGAQET